MLVIGASAPSVAAGACRGAHTRHTLFVFFVLQRFRKRAATPRAVTAVAENRLGRGTRAVRPARRARVGQRRGPRMTRHGFSESKCMAHTHTSPLRHNWPAHMRNGLQTCGHWRAALGHCRARQRRPSATPQSIRARRPMDRAERAELMPRDPSPTGQADARRRPRATEPDRPTRKTEGTSKAPRKGWGAQCDTRCDERQAPASCL